MHAVKRTVSVPVSRRVEIELPADFPEGEAEIIALAAGRPAPSTESPRPGSIEVERAAPFADRLRAARDERPSAEVCTSDLVRLACGRAASAVGS